ncbi:hypothetical protein [Oceanobacillus kimchii]|uniref:hypothetical protein n=1 Tax=Oceanobacillus kimchii TaxID=746691 RepID=UPI001AD8A9C3|nr:hypothetical protein [Oceanobacillus kimchii]
MMTIMSIGLSMYVVENKKSVNILKFIYFVFTLYVTIYLLLGNTLRDISEVSSENFFSAMFLFLSILVVTANYYWSSKILIYPGILTLIVSFIALTRSSIIASLLLFLLLIFIKFSYRFNKAQLIIIFLAVITTILIFVGKIEDLIFNVLYRYGTRSSFIESQRLNIWEDYFSDFDIIKFIFGDGTGEHVYGGFINLHNSYLMYHQTFGILIIGIIILFVVSMVYAFYSKKYTYAILLTVLLVRIGFDEVMLVWAYDYVLITVILCIYLDKKKQIKLE